MYISIDTCQRTRRDGAHERIDNSSFSEHLEETKRRKNLGSEDVKVDGMRVEADKTRT